MPSRSTVILTPMSKKDDVSNGTMSSIQRQRITKTQKQLAADYGEDDSLNIWKENWFDKYEKKTSRS